MQILISMAQVQEGLIPTFDITLPETFVRLLRLINFWSINIPLSCIVNINYHHRLVYRTLGPLCIEVLLWCVSKLAKAACRPDIEAGAIDWLFTVMFLVYPSCTASVFRMYVCHTFDDGSKFLAVDYSIDCYSSEHAWYLAYTLAMILIWPFGVPLIYLIVLSNKRKLLCRLEAIELCYVQQTSDRLLKQDAESAVMKEAERFLHKHTQHETSTMDVTNPETSAKDVVTERIEGWIEEQAGAFSLDFMKEGDFMSLTGDDGLFASEAHLVREEVQRLWEEKQPVLGMDLADTASGVMVGPVVWPTFNLVPCLLNETAYTLVEEPSAGVSPAGSVESSPTSSVRSPPPLSPRRSSRAFLNSLQVSQGVEMESVVLERLLAMWDALQQESVELGEIGAAQAQRETERLSKTLSKTMVLAHVLEHELARRAYWRSAKKEVSVRATKRWSQLEKERTTTTRKGWRSFVPRSPPRRGVKSQEMVEEISEQLLIKDWRRMDEETKASWLKDEAVSRSSLASRCWMLIMRFAHVSADQQAIARGHFTESRRHSH